MAYIPKYIIKRMIKKNAVKLVEGGIELEFINIISPLEIYEVPDNFLEYILVSIDGKQVNNEIINEVSVKNNEDTYKIKDAQTFVGKIIPVGAILKIFVPGLELEKGKEYEISIKIVETTIDVTVKRTVQ